MKKFYAENELARLAKELREKAGKSKVEVARELNVSAPAVFAAEEKPKESLTALRIRIIEQCSQYKVGGPVFTIKKA